MILHDGNGFVYSVLQITVKQAITIPPLKTLLPPNWYGIAGKPGQNFYETVKFCLVL
jgi:hypothetical protein